MATSEEKGFIEETNGPGSPNLRTYNVKANNALHVDWVRTLINNWHHAYDQSTQVRVAWVSSGGLSPSRTFTDADTYEHIASFGGFPWAVRYDRTLMRPVFRLAGAVDNASYELTFKPCLMFYNDPVNHEFAIASTEIVVSSTTPVWLVAGSAYFSPTANFQSSVFDMQTLDVAGGAPITTQSVMCRLDVWVKSDDAAATATLSGLYLREYIGT